MNTLVRTLPLALLGSLAAAGCNSNPDPEESAAAQAPFELRFAAMVDGRKVGCADDLTGFGPSGKHHIGINDLRFYVSNLRFADAQGQVVAATLDSNEFQYASANGSVALIDLTDSSTGSCGSSSLAYSEGTGRTHLAITGKTNLQRVSSVSFDVGVPQALMKKTIATSTPEGAPSPLNEMYWNWNSGYRHLVFNFSVRDAAGGVGAGYLHIGSRDCAPTGEGTKALSDRDTCTFVNTPAVALTSFNLATDTVGLDLRQALDGVDFISPIYDPSTFAVIGQGPGVECHSSPMQSNCPAVFGKFGLDIASGKASSAADVVFARMR